MSGPVLPHCPAASATNTSDNEAIDASIAAAPCDIASVPSLLDDITHLRRGFDASTRDRASRLALLAKARTLVQALETPRETMLRHVGAETACFFSLALGVDIGLFVELAKEQGCPKTTASLAKALNFDADALSTSPPPLLK